MVKNWLLAMDLDGTLWDHLDITAVKPPYRYIGNNTIINDENIKIRLNLDAVNFILWCRENGAYVTSLSWNKPENALEAIKAFGIEHLFDFHAIEYVEDKSIYLKKVLDKLRNMNVNIAPERIVYVDDRDIHINKIREKIGNVVFIHIWKEVKDFKEAKEIVKRIIFNQ